MPGGAGFLPSTVFWPWGVKVDPVWLATNSWVFVACWRFSTLLKSMKVGKDGWVKMWDLHVQNLSEKVYIIPALLTHGNFSHGTTKKTALTQQFNHVGLIENQTLILNLPLICTTLSESLGTKNRTPFVEKNRVIHPSNKKIGGPPFMLISLSAISA